MSQIPGYNPTENGAVRATVITDASFCPETNAGGWAAWVTMNSGRYRYAGMFKDLPRTPTEAELWASLNGVWIAVTYGANEVLLQTDCMNVVDTLNYKKTPHLHHFVGVELVARHVRGHTNIQAPRFFVNRWCDGQAKKHMRLQRATIQNESEFTAQGFY